MSLFCYCFAADNGRLCNPPLFLLPASHWTASSASLVSHWTSPTSSELILVKNSLAREGLKIEPYIKTAADPRCALVLAGGAGRAAARRPDTRRKKKEQYRSSPTKPSLLLILSEVLHQQQRYVLHRARPPLLGGAGNDELPSFLFDSWVSFSFLFFSVSVQSNRHFPQWKH